MKQDLFFPSSDNLTTIHAIEWIPDKEITAILQISHGMVEFIDRYDCFARYLNEHGIYVVGNDHLGHGLSVTSDDRHGYFKDPDGNECVIKDLHRLRKLTQKKYPGVPYFMLGHSMGSFMIRQYMMVHGEGLSGVIVMGTGSQPKPVLAAGKLICKMMAKVKGWDHRSKLVDGMAFSSNNKKFEPARTKCDWLTKDTAIVDAYLANPWCTFLFTSNGFYQMFSAIEFVQKKKNINRIPKDLPILLVSGADDPVGNFGNGVKKVYKAFDQARVQDLTMTLYEGCRHEILNEVDKEAIFESLKDWIEEKQ